MNLFSWFSRKAKKPRLRKRIQPDPFLFAMYESFREDDVEKLKAAAAGKELGNFSDDRNENHWLAEAMKNSVSIDVLQTLIDLGVDPHAYPDHGDFGPLPRAVLLGRVDYVQYLLDTGVDPNGHLAKSRLTLTAVGSRIEATKQVELLQLLIAHGVDLNHEFPWFGDETQTVTVLDHANADEVCELLRSHGARNSSKPLTDPEGALRESLRD